MSSATEYIRKRKERRERLEIRKARFEKGDKVFCIKHTYVNLRGFPTTIKKTHPGVIYTVMYNIGGIIRILETDEHIHHSKFISLMEYRLLKIKKLKKELIKKRNAERKEKSNIKKT